MKQIFIAITLVLMVAAFFSCKENSLEKQRSNELKSLNEFMRTQYPGKEPQPSGLYYFELQEGTGDSIKIGDRVQLFYELWTLDSVNIGSNGSYEPLEVVVAPPTQLSSSATHEGQMRALHEALTYMKRGSKARLIFDSSLGFGQFGASGIPGFLPLIMEVEVYKVYPAPVQEQ